MARRRASLRLVVAFTALAVLAGCSGSGATQASPIATATPAAATASPPPAATAAPTPTPIPTPSPRPAAWLAAGSIEPGLAFSHMAVLGTGDVLIAGDDWTNCPMFDMVTMETSAEASLYHPADDAWQDAPSLNAPRGGFSLVPMKDGRAMVIGGATTDFIPYSSVKIYDPISGKWSQPGLLKYARYAPVATLLQDGRILVTGGMFGSWLNGNARTVAQTELFDPEAGTWSQTGSLHTSRMQGRAVTLTDGRVLVAGGDNLDGNYADALNAEVWDPATGAWTVTGSLPVGSIATAPDFSLVALPDGSALAVGVLSASAVAALRWDPATGRWSPAGQMISPAYLRTAVLLADGRVLVAGGIRIKGGVVADVEIYDPAAGIWTATAPLPEPRGGSVAVLLEDGSVLLAGGYNASTIHRPATSGGNSCPTVVKGAVRYLPTIP
jgi:hypothetical protein